MMTRIRALSHYFLWFLIICFIALIVIEWGANYSDIARTKRGIVGKIDGNDIRYMDFQTAYYNQIKQTQEQRGGEALSETEMENISEQIWNQVVEEMLLREFIRKNDVAVSDSEIAFNLRMNPPDFLRQSPSFQTDGNFDFTKYQQALNNPAFAKEWTQIEAFLRAQLPFNKVQTMVNTAVSVSESEIRMEFMRRNLKLNGQFIYFSPAEFKPEDVSVSDDDLMAYYKEHQDDFKEKEKARLVFVSFNDHPTADDSAAILEKVEGIRKEAVEGRDFSELANAYSEDKAANQSGGSLGWFTRGAMVKEFEEACFNGKPGQIIGPVKTQFGYHIIKIEETRFFDERARKKKSKDGKELQDSVKASHVLVKMAASQQTIEMARENANGFTEAANDGDWATAMDKYESKYGLRIDTTAEILNNDQGMVGGFPDRLRNVVRFAFSESIGATSKPFKTTYGYTVFRAIERTDARVKPFDDVKDRIRSSVVEEKRRELAYKKAQEFKSRMGSALADAKTVDSSIVIRDLKDFTMSSSIPAVGRDAKLNGMAFRVPVGTVSDVIRGSRGSYIIQVASRDDFDEKTYQSRRADLKKQLLSTRQQRSYREWVDALKKQAKIEDFRPDFNL